MTDGRDAVGTVDVIDDRYVAIDVDGNIIGSFDTLRCAVCALPDGRPA